MARKILLADDSVTAQNMGRKILADAGYEVLTVNNGSAALKKIAEAKPELIILDVYMPGYSGLEVCQRIKEAGETSRIPILLTVGKLEPFKPEEAKRVRADGYIVKPFEASELLSALSKLEDKIVPGRESHKSGRFARANAAIDSYDKSVAIEEDTSWKSRISFPSKKKKEVQEDGDDPAIYNALNKDLRTVVDHKSAAKPQEMAVEPEKVNVGALASEGLPKDVTPEEIAALAAAAAQIKSTTESKVVEPAKAETETPVEAKASEAMPGELQPLESKTEAAVQQLQPAAEAAQPMADPTPVPDVAEEKIEQKSEKPEEPVSQDSAPLPNPADVAAALVALERETKTSQESDSGREPAVRELVEEPITMAVAAGAEYSPRASRWTAVPAALAPDEIALSLEQEMQKAHAAFAAAEAVYSQAATAVIEAETPVSGSTPVSSEPVAVESPVHDAAAVIAAPDEVAEASAAVASAATEAVTEAVKELEAVAASYEAKLQQPDADIPAIAVSAEGVSEPEAPVAEVLSVQSEAPLPEPKQEDTAGPIQHESGRESAPQIDEENKPVEQGSESSAETLEAAACAPESKVSEEDRVESHVAPHGTEPVASGQLAAGGIGDMGKKESDIAETTAAAWASWRRIREEKPESSRKHDDDSDEAAMAVAAGAENSPEAASSEEESPEIASIVDSVLADLRPRIVEEISRKLGKKR